MPRVTFVQADGREDRCDVAVGLSLLDGALDNGVPGFVGQCGGAATCGTCRCFVDDAWEASIPPAEGNEADLLPYLDDGTPGARLACQIRVTAVLDGIRVRLPASQFPEGSTSEGPA